MLTAPPRPLPKFQPVTCPECRVEYHGLSPRGVCWNCDEKAAIAKAIAYSAAKILDNIAEEVTKRLVYMGMGAREMLATRAGIPKPIAHAFAGHPRRAVEDLADGRIPKVGFGLTGPTGVGKSCALAALVQVYVEQMIRRTAPIEGKVPMDVSVIWCSWPAEAEWLRSNGTEPKATARRMADLEGAPLLILDDLGAEGRKGGYEDDYSTKKLDLVIDARSREMRPTIWTSNMDEIGVAKTYGGRISSRLLGECPPIAVTGPDLRLS